MIVCKFGGSSLSSKESIEKVAAILRDNADRCFVVVSAMGRAAPSEEKITDLLIKAYYGDDNAWNEACDRHIRLCNSIGISIIPELDLIRHRYLSGCGFDFFVSRGEYLMAKIVSEYLHMTFIDGSEIAAFSENGRWLFKKTLEKASANLKKYGSGVIAGFYGSDDKGNIHLFERGGSDISGAIAAYAVDADLYENWTDVDGFLSVAPSASDNARVIRCLSYRELSELSYYGANVLHYMTVKPLVYKLIPLNVRNTFNVKELGTTVTYRSLPGIKGLVEKKGVYYEVQGGEELLTLFPEALKTVDGIRFFSSDTDMPKKIVKTGAVLKMKMTEASVIAVAGCYFDDFKKACDLLCKNKIEPLYAEYINRVMHITVEKRYADYAVRLIYDKLIGEDKS